MRNDMYEGRWSPFDPQWYQAAFDKFISTADQLFNSDLIIQQGFNLPDADKSRSSVFRKDAILTNTFNENDLRETLKDIYLNSTHRLVASNHDNVNFFKWDGYMSQMELIPNTEYCKFIIPTDTFISSKERDIFKRSQFYRKWIKVEDILNNWNIFKWHCMLFINQKIYSEYELRIDDHEVAIKFKYYDHWLKDNLPVYIYKFDTSSQSRILISKELVLNRWNWKVPIDYVNDKRVANAENIMVAFNKISDPEIRKDGLEHIEVLGDNLEFLKVEDGYIDISKISDFNKIYIESESTEWLWMSIITPKFFHEYPILLPTDSIYRPYEANFQKVSVLNYEKAQHVKTMINRSEYEQVYVDMNGKIKEKQIGWKTLIRPIVLGDAFDNPYDEPYNRWIDEVTNLRDLTVAGADLIEEFRFFILDYYDQEEEFNLYLDKLLESMEKIKNAQDLFMEKLNIEPNDEYERLYKRFLLVMKTIREDGIYSEWFSNMTNRDDESEEESEENNSKDFWFFISPLIFIPRELYDKYAVVNIINGMGHRRILWADVEKYLGQIRFRRPIEENDFWTFEYDNDNRVWRPYPLKINRHFPDVYIPTDPNEKTPSLNRIFKTFFFYSDTMNVLEEAGDIERATASWDEDMEMYELDKGAVYRDIFMEKFYWMGVRSIYRGILSTHARWEAIEYVIDNNSYERFNELFLNTMDPYFKLGLATYLKSSNYEFPFDDAISKMEESINNLWNGYKRVTNFEIYLNKTWIPSYFDYIVKIMDNWDYGNRLLRRPRSTFDINRLLPIMIAVQTNTSRAVSLIDSDVDWIIKMLTDEDYHLTINNYYMIKKVSSEMLNNINTVLEYTKDLDLVILSIDDINHIANLFRQHSEYVNEIEKLLDVVYVNAEKYNVHENKRSIIEQIVEIVKEFPNHISKISAMIQDFDIEGFMRAINDLRSYFDHAKTNPDDNSLIGYINKFEDPWSVSVKEYRNKLFISTSKMYATFDPDKSYTDEEVNEFVTLVEEIKNDIGNFRNKISEFWTRMKYEKDQLIIDKLDHTEEYISGFKVSIDKYMDARKELLDTYYRIKKLLESLYQYDISEIEQGYDMGIQNGAEGIIQALSYIAGKNKKDEALISLNIINNHLLDWTNFLNIERSVFDRIFSISKPPTEFMTTIRADEDMMNVMIEYMDTVNIPFIPDSSWPTYSDIYYVNEIELTSGGFNHQIGEDVFIPFLGSYRITSIDGSSCTATMIEDLHYRTTQFRDPMCQSNPFDAITNGDGLGITVKPLSSTRIRIINDEAVIPYITRIKNNLYLIENNIIIPNPFQNKALSDILNSVTSIQHDWDVMLKKYYTYMTEEVRVSVEETIKEFMNIIQPTELFIDKRSNINLSGFLDLFDKFIIKYQKMILDTELEDSSYHYYDELCQIEYMNLYKFYDGGTTWNDTTMLKTLLDQAKKEITLFKHKVLDVLEENEEIVLINNIYDEMIEMISIIKTTIDEFPNSILDTNLTIDRTKKKLDVIPSELQKDIWYIIKHVSVAQGGRGYKIGDVIEIIPELPTDNMGEPIHDNEKVIMNDVILLQVTEVNDDGEVITIKPLMNYAIPYMIWGIRNTISRIGNGMNLKLDVYSYPINLTDSTLFESEDSYVPLLPPFDENDMFMFKFENIHDLDIQYEVFFDGKQIQNVIHRHLGANNPLHPKNIDILYLNANEVMNLRNSSIYIPAENYFIYRIENLEIIDPGAGYAVGQDIFVDVECAVLKLKVTELLYGPYKGIANAEISENSPVYKGDDPTCNHAKVIPDSLNNIDDEFNDGYYDRLTKEGIYKPATMSLDPEKYKFWSHRFDDLDDGIRNKHFMYPDVDMPDVEGTSVEGDPDSHWYLGSRIDNSQHPMEDSRRWNGIMNVIPPTDSFIKDSDRIPNNQPIKGEYQTIARQRFHDSLPEDILEGQNISNDVTVIFDFTLNNAAMVEGDLVVPNYASLPKHTKEWPDAAVGKIVIVENDETNKGHRMAYPLRTFVAAGFFVWDLPKVADFKFNYIDIDWMNCDFYPDYPSIKSQYPTANWRNAKNFRAIQREINDEKHKQYFVPKNINHTSYISDLTIDDLSVWNWNTHEWEDLHNEERWKLEVRNDDENEDWGFRLTLIEDGVFSYDMQLFLNKVPENQIRNSSLKRDAVLDISAVIAGEVNTPAINTSINTGRHLRIRKLFPYEQKESYVIGKDIDGNPLGYEMDFKLANYIHYKNEIHLEDIKIYNKSAGRFEDILDRQLFEVRFKDDKAIDSGYEIQTNIIQSIIGTPGEGFVNGNAWAWNEEFAVHVFAYITAAFTTDGHILTFTPIHCVNAPEEDVALEFQVYQRATQSKVQSASVMIEFNTEKVEVHGDGYIHNVQNRMAPVPKEFKVICQYNLSEPTEYDIIISKSPKKFTFCEPKWLMAPTFHLDNYSIQEDRVYVLTDKGRFPNNNPSTGKPTLQVVETGTGTDVTFLNLYRRYEHLEVHTTPYPFRTVYVQRHIPPSGFIDLKGKLNKPLNKKYFEFWVNGKMMYDEVTIITPTKIFLHGLKSLKNLEIIEVNRDSNEYFSDSFLEVSYTDSGKPIQSWNFENYLDNALEGILEGDNYTEEEQGYLLAPVWEQVTKDHPEFKNYPPNVDNEDDVLVRVSEDDHSVGEIEDPLYQFLIIDPPTLETKPIVDQRMSFEHFGFTPITNAQITEILNEIWAEEIAEDPYFKQHTVMTDDEWFGMTARLYDEYGIRVHRLNEAVYKVANSNLIRININNKLTRIVKNTVNYDLT